jgi:hypothetical protein
MLARVTQALIDVGGANDISEPVRAIAHERSNQIQARCTIQARRTGTLVDVNIANIAGVPWRTGAHEPKKLILTRAFV